MNCLFNSDIPQKYLVYFFSLRFFSGVVSPRQAFCLTPLSSWLFMFVLRRVLMKPPSPTTGDHVFMRTYTLPPDIFTTSLQCSPDHRHGSPIKPFLASSMVNLLVIFSSSLSCRQRNNSMINGIEYFTCSKVRPNNQLCSLTAQKHPAL